MADEEAAKYENPFKVDLKWKPNWTKKSASSSVQAKPSSTAPKAAPKWLPVPKMVMACFALNLIFIVVAVIESGLVLGGTIQVKANAIGLTQSLVFISAMFGIVYMAFHAFAARKAECAAGGRSNLRSPLHTKIVILGRITVSLWAIAMLAVGITLASQPASAASSLGPVRVDLAASIINCIDMVFVEFVVERTAHPFVLPWITPPTPEGQSSSAKALIDDILGDGVSGHSRRDSAEYSAASKEAAPPKLAAQAGATVPPVDHTGSAGSTAGFPFLAPGQIVSEPFPSPGSTLVERQELWDRVDEGTYKASPPKPAPAAAAPSFIPPVPLPARTIDPYGRSPYPPSPYISPLQNMPLPRPPFATAAPDSFPPFAPSPSIGGPRPLSETGRMHSYTAHINSQQTRPAFSPLYGDRTPGARSGPGGPRPGGKRLFNKAAEGLRANGAKEASRWDDWSSYRVPGSFVEM